VTAKARKCASGLIEAELGRLPQSDREKVADQILGALESVFMFLPHTVLENRAAAQAELDTMLPGIFGDRGRASS
jgi:hypothetical protein